MLPTTSALDPSGLQLIPLTWWVFGLAIRVIETPSYFNTKPEVPPMRAYEPSGFQAIVLRSMPVGIPVGIWVSWVPFHLISTAESPTIKA